MLIISIIKFESLLDLRQVTKITFRDFFMIFAPEGEFFLPA